VILKGTLPLQTPFFQGRCTTGRSDGINTLYILRSQSNIYFESMDTTVRLYLAPKGVTH